MVLADDSKGELKKARYCRMISGLASSVVTDPETEGSEAGSEANTCAPDAVFEARTVGGFISTISSSTFFVLVNEVSE